jgi:hypothetical protein
MQAHVDLSGLTPVERELLRVGVIEWERADGDHDATARLLGYGSRRELGSDVLRLAVTIDLGPVFTGSHPQFSAESDAVNSLTLRALVQALDLDASVIVLDWHHTLASWLPIKHSNQ